MWAIKFVFYLGGEVVKILKRGNKSQKFPINKIWKKKCKKCGYKFEFDYFDIYPALSVLGTTNYYIRCPQCDESYYVAEC